MDASELERLYERLIAQEPYEGGTCPTERTVTRFLAGPMSEAERVKLEAHLEQCAGCRDLVASLRTSSAWFEANQRALFERFIEKAAAAGLPPWAACPSPDVLEAYAAGAVPDTEAGRKFRRQLESQLQQNSFLREALQRVKESLTRKVVIRLADLGRQAADAAADLHDMLLGLREAALAPAMAPARGVRGFRASVSPTVDAVVVDRTGALALDDSGKPRTVRFHVIRAEVEPDGRLVLDLSTEDPTVRAGAGRRFVVNATIQHGHWRLVLPSEPIYSEGRVAFACNLVEGVEIHDLPASAIRLTLAETQDD
jgi:hypothetical protein